MFDESVLDDAARLTEDEAGVLLRAAAWAGAQVRATAEAATEIAGETWRGARPRALTFVARPGVGAAATDILVALLGEAARIPVVRSETVPSWTGPLDVVFVYSDDPGDVRLAESIHAAGRRGAGMLLVAEDEGPVAAAGAGYASLLASRVPVPPGFGFPRALAAGLWLLDALELRSVDVAALAEALDVEAAGSHPDKESFVNPAKSLALRLAERTPLLWGLDPVGTAVARYARRCLGAHAGVVADAEGYEEALVRPGLRLLATRAGESDDIFHDPEDEPTAAARARLLLVGVGSGHEADVRRDVAMNRFPGSDVLSVASELGEAGADPAVCAAVSALRVEMAALYLGVASGVAGGYGSGQPDTVAPAGRY